MKLYHVFIIMFCAGIFAMACVPSSITPANALATYSAKYVDELKRSESLEKQLDCANRRVALLEVQIDRLNATIEQLRQQQQQKEVQKFQVLIVPLNS